MRFLADSNILVALVVEQHEFHSHCLRWLGQLKLDDRVVLCPAVQLSFLRLLTQPMAPDYKPASNARAWEIWDDVLRDHRFLWSPDLRYDSIQWKRFSTRNTPSAKLWMDGLLASLAKENHLHLVTLDKGFKQFDGIDAVILGHG